MDPNEPSDPTTPPEVDGPGFIIISLTGDIDPVTDDCTVNFQASLPNATEPALTLNFYELVPNSSNTADYLPITVANPPTPSWSNGVATFALTMDSDIFDQLSSTQTNFAVIAQITGNSNSQGICTFAIDLSTP